MPKVCPEGLNIDRGIAEKKYQFMCGRISAHGACMYRSLQVEYIGDGAITVIKDHVVFLAKLN